MKQRNHQIFLLMHTYNYYFLNSPQLGQREYRFGLRTLEISNPARQPMRISEVSIDGESESSTNHLQRLSSLYLCHTTKAPGGSVTATTLGLKSGHQCYHHSHMLGPDTDDSFLGSGAKEPSVSWSWSFHASPRPSSACKHAQGTGFLHHSDFFFSERLMSNHSKKYIFLFSSLSRAPKQVSIESKNISQDLLFQVFFFILFYVLNHHQASEY